MSKLDHGWVRSQFPSLGLTLAQGPVAFFDNPAGTQVPQRVIDAMGSYLACANANTHGDFLTSQRTDAVIAQARQLSAAFVGARSSNEIVFGANMTTLTYSLSRALGRSWAAGDEVIVTDLDHDANISPWLELTERGIVVRRIPVQLHDGTLDLDSFQRLLSRKTRLVAVGYASNALGTINDVGRIAQMAHSVGARVWVDAVHYGPHGPIDVQAIEADYLVCSAYKFFGPHLGILWGKESHLDELRASQVRPAPRTSPEKFETGTKNHEGLAGLVGAFGYLGELGGAPDLLAQGAAGARAGLLRAMHAVRGYELELGAQLLQGLNSVRGLRLYGLSSPADLQRRVPTFGFTLQGKDSLDVSRSLAEQGIFTWAGHHYALTLMDRLGLSEQGGVVRVGAVHYNTASEVERLVGALQALSP